jgi:glyoxylase-like metal-dependent hydrolase (beta-lactamase superfamily II)
MIFETIVVGPLAVNCYIVACPETLEAIVVDPGDSADRILPRLKALSLKVRYIVNTHGHFDHVGANGAIKETTGAKLLIHREDEPMLARAKTVAATYGVVTNGSPPADDYLIDGQELSIGSLALRVIHTPGHSLGGCSFLIGGKLLTGDTLFADSVGRTDLPGGDEETLHASIRGKLYPLADEIEVCPGHGPGSTIGREKRSNPYVRG